MMQNTLVALELNIFQKIFKKPTENKNIDTNTYRIEAHNSIICGYFCIEFIGFVLKVKIFFDYTNLFYTNEYEKNYKVILKYYQ